MSNTTSPGDDRLKDEPGQRPEPTAEQRRESAPEQRPESAAEQRPIHTPEVAAEAYSHEPERVTPVSAPEPQTPTTIAPQAQTTIPPRTPTPRADAQANAANRDTATDTASIYPAAAFEEPRRSDVEHTEAPRTLQKPIYVQAPTPPHEKGNRGFGILVSLLSTVVFAVLYGALIAGLRLLDGGSIDIVGGILARAPFWAPVVAFFIASVVAVAIINRSGWWAHVFAGFFIALVTYGAYLGGAVLDQAFRLSPEQVQGFIAQIWLTAPGVIAFVVAREVPLWFGAWIAARGRKVTERNETAQREYEQLLEHGPSL